MSAKILDGKLLAQNIKEALRIEVELLKSKKNVSPSLVNILIGEDEASKTYAHSQKKTAENIGIQFKLESFKSDVSVAKVKEFIHKLNDDKNIHGIMIHNPVPKHFDYQQLTDSISVLKDVEGMSAGNIGKILFGTTKIIPCTPASVLEHIKSTGIKLAGKEAVIVGRSEIVGKPLILLLLQENMTVTSCHSYTDKAGLLSEHLKRADVVVASVGKPEFIKGEWIKKGAVVIDVGINHLKSKIVGDVDFESAKKHAAFITPVPGGVGPVTVVMLMKNIIEACKIQNKKI